MTAPRLEWCTRPAEERALWQRRGWTVHGTKEALRYSTNGAVNRSVSPHMVVILHRPLELGGEEVEAV